ncbi:MAG: Dabb family protein [Provencibacterium sp.]|jgi:hypothetical protein|nr:Dabb family protein [Provencibacterium sp.]
MIKHMVMWKLRAFDSPAGREEAEQRIKTGLEALVGVVPGLRYAQVGKNFNPQGYDLCLYTELDSREALEGYQVHPEHQKMREFIHTVIVERAVCDWEA